VASQEVSLRGGTSVIDSSIPSLINSVLEDVRIAPEISAAYGLTFPFLRFGSYTVNTWTFLFIVYGMLCKRIGLSLLQTLFVASAVMIPDVLHVKAVGTVGTALLLCYSGWMAMYTVQ
jgi:hypothetical protein